MEESSNVGLECFWQTEDHPRCAHGPTLLFGKYINGESEQFYACSACRDRKLCKFYLKHGETLTESRQNAWEEERKKFARRYNHKKLFVHFNALLVEGPKNRCYCHDCEKLIFAREKGKHEGHSVLEDLTDYQMHHPTEILKPLSNSKKEAQYLFSKKSVEDIVNMLLQLEVKQIICVGTPRIHEYILEHLDDKISSLLLDFDGRFHSFFGPLNYCWYNLFNHHFFTEEAQSVFMEFIAQNQGRNTYLLCDPPFGGRVEAMSQTIKRISDLHRKVNKIKNDENGLKVMFIFPYFMESIMKKKSNPPLISGGLKDLKMSDYKVDYENHPLFLSNGRKLGSPIRIYTNVPLSLLKLPECDGYKYCKKCKKWISAENRHCIKCNECTSKDGRTYIHCDLCKRCVKPTWEHCNDCNKCNLKRHTCNAVLSISGRCFKCNEIGHIEKNCKLIRTSVATTKSVNRRKRNIKIEHKSSSIKKKKIQNVTLENEISEKSLKATKINLSRTNAEYKCLTNQKDKMNSNTRQFKKNGENKRCRIIKKNVMNVGNTSKLKKITIRPKFKLEILKRLERLRKKTRLSMKSKNLASKTI